MPFNVFFRRWDDNIKHAVQYATHPTYIVHVTKFLWKDS